MEIIDNKIQVRSQVRDASKSLIYQKSNTTINTDYILNLYSYTSLIQKRIWRTFKQNYRY